LSVIKTTYDFTFSSAEFVKGDAISITMNPTNVPGDVQVTIKYNFNTNS
jgi:hypothetical protein